MKKLLLTFSFAVLFTSISMASHLVGGYISYEHLGNNDYKITMKLYRDCAGVPAPVNPYIYFHSTTLSIDTSLMLSTDTFSVLTANTCVPQGLTSCQGGTAFGVEEYIYSSTIHLDPAPDWHMDFAECCRNAAITTIDPLGFLITTNLDNSTGPNNSPSFNYPIFNEYCAGNFTILDYSCTDIDGDSLVYRLDSCLDGQALPPYDTAYSVTYHQGYNYQNFLTSFIPITMNASSGIIYCLPAFLEIAVLSVVVDEYRNGIKIGSMKRDDEVVVSGGMQNPNVITGKVFVDFNNNQVMDTNDIPLNGRLMQATPSPYFATTNTSGNYSMDMITGLYTISIVNPSPYTPITPAFHTANFLSLGQIDSLNDFALFPVPGVVDLRVTITGLPPTGQNLYRNYWIEVENIGTQATGGTLEFTFDPLLSFVSAIPSIGSQAGQTITWTLPIIQPWTSETFEAKLQISPFAVIGDTLESFATVYPTSTDTNFADNTYYLHQRFVQSCDPNFKEVQPDGNITQPFVQNGDWLEYTIHFQNIGTGPASHVKLMDGLDANLDIASFEKLASSHNSNYSISGPGLLTVNYWNINLEAASVNEPASHGFFKYRIRPKTTLIAGDQIVNAANIFFDTNAPIGTNTTITTVVNITVIEEIKNSTIQALFYPNPSGGMVNIRTGNQELKLIVMDISGRLLYSKMIHGDTSFDMTGWDKGIYLYRLESEKGEYAAGKIIKQ